MRCSAVEKPIRIFHTPTYLWLRQDTAEGSAGQLQLGADYICDPMSLLFVGMQCDKQSG
jgi:hypothetical protein